jgi:hypothetical protein
VVRELAGAVDDPCKQLEAKLTSSCQKSPWQKAAELLDLPGLGDCLPSALMNEMSSLLPYDVMPNWLCSSTTCLLTC